MYPYWLFDYEAFKKWDVKVHSESLMSQWQDDGFGNMIDAPMDTDMMASVFAREGLYDDCLVPQPSRT